MKTKVRDSNYELLRIVSMLFIITWHILINGMVLYRTSGSVNFSFNFLFMIIVVHVNLFMLITGYYQSKSEFKLKKVISFLLQIAFYNLIINSIFKVFGLVEYTNVEFLKQIAFYNSYSYWFFSCYIITYIISPFLNKFIVNLDKKEFKKLIGCLVLCFSVLPFLTGNLLFSTNGYSVYQFVLMYFIGAYIRKFNLNKNLLKKINISQKRVIYIVIFILCTIFNFSLIYLQKQMAVLDSNILNSLANIMKDYSIFYNNPLVIIQAISLFLLFGTFDFKNKVINKISSLTFGVYLIHESYYMRMNLYKWIGIDNGKMIYGKSILLKVFVCAIIIFILCAIIEWIRQLLFKLISKLRFVEKIDSKFMTWLTNILEIK